MSELADELSASFLVIMTIYKPGKPAKRGGKAPNDLKELKNKEFVFDLTTENYDDFLKAILKLYEWDLELKDPKKPFPFSYRYGSMRYELPINSIRNVACSPFMQVFAKLQTSRRSPSIKRWWRSF
jgi:hypothetical protein